jgi:hypothetical protein
MFDKFIKKISNAMSDFIKDDNKLLLLFLICKIL